MSNIYLQDCGFSTTIEKDNADTIDVIVQALHTGVFTDMNGTEVVVDDVMLEGLCTAYNDSAAKCLAIDMETNPSMAKIKLEEFDNRNAPNQLNHNASDANLTVGHVIGLMNIKEINNKKYLFCKLRVKGAENVARVKDKRWRNVSMGFNLDTLEFNEISWVVKGAAYEAHTLLQMSSGNNKKSQIFTNFIDNIQAKQNNIIAMKKELNATKHLIALSKIGVLNMAQINKIKPHLSKFDNPKAVIELMEMVVPDKKFKPLVIEKSKNLNFFNELLKGDTSMASNQTPQKIDMTQLSDPATALSYLESYDSNVTLAEPLQHAYINEPMESVVGYKELGAKHRELMKLSSDCYKLGDVEKGDKYADMAMRLSEEAEMGRAKLSDYDIETAANDNDEVKELAKKIEASEKEVKEEVKKELAKFEEKLGVMLAANANANKAEIKTLSDCIILLTKKSLGGE